MPIDALPRCWRGRSGTLFSGAVDRGLKKTRKQVSDSEATCGRHGVDFYGVEENQTESTGEVSKPDPRRHIFQSWTFQNVENGQQQQKHLKLSVYESRVLSSQPQSVFFTVITCNHGDCSENLRRYISTSCSPELVIYRLSSSWLLAIRARVGRLLASHTLSLYTWLSSQV